MARHTSKQDGWLLTDLFHALGIRRRQDEPAPSPEPLAELLAACDVLLSDMGEASMRAVAQRALQAYAELDDAAKLHFFRHMLTRFGVDEHQLREHFATWDADPTPEKLAALFDVTEPRRQQLLRRINYAPGATEQLVQMRADLLRMIRTHSDLKPLDKDFRHLLASWFNRGFLTMKQIGWDADSQLKNYLLQFEKVHPMGSSAELKRRLQPKDRRCYAFFHPATGDLPLIFVEVALTQGIPDSMAPLLEPGPALSPQKADTAALYSINNSLEGLAGISFGSFLIKQVIDQVSDELPHLQNFVTLSPIPGFRRWLQQQAQQAQASGDTELASLQAELKDLEQQTPGPDDTVLHTESHTPDGAQEQENDDAVAKAHVRIRHRLYPVLARYITAQRHDGKPMDPVARFHLGNGASAWQLHWPASSTEYAWKQSFGAMINYRYDPAELEAQHETYVRHRTVALGPQLKELLQHPEELTHQRGQAPMAETFSTIYESFLRNVQQHPEKPLFLPEDGEPISYAQTLETTHRIAAVLLEDGVQPGDRVAMQVQKSPEALALYLATLQIGGVFLPLNTAYTGKEMDYFIQDAGPKVLVVSPDTAEDHAHRGESGVVVETLGTSGDGTLLRGSGAHTDAVARTAEDPASILYTSGTTGRSKGAVLTHGNLASNCQALLDTWEYTGEDVLIHALPIFHIHGLFVAANMTLAAGATMRWLPKFDADTILRLMPDSTVLMGVPTFYTRLLKSPELNREVCAGMRLFVSGSAPLLASDHEAFEERTGHAILERYGMTETGMNTTNPYRGARKPGTVGKPFPGIEIRIVDRETGEQLPDGEVGLIEVRGPNVFAGYWQMPEKTAQEFRADGYFITGDLGRLDEDGYLCIVGRDKDMVISGGYNIYPKEIEELIDAHPAVLESAVIGVPHPDLGEAVVAVVVPASGEQPQEEEILQFISGDLARFKQPRAFRCVEALPRNVMGKVQKAQLRTTYQDTFTGVPA